MIIPLPIPTKVNNNPIYKIPYQNGIPVLHTFHTDLYSHKEYAPVRQPPVESIIDLLIAGYRIKYPYFAGDFTQELKSTEYLTEFLKMFGRDFDAMKIRKETYDFKKLFDFQSFGETEDSEKVYFHTQKLAVIDKTPNGWMALLHDPDLDEDALV